MAFQSTTWKSKLYTNGLTEPFSKLAQIAVQSSEYRSGYGFTDVVSSLKSKGSGNFKLSGEPGTGKTTRFPLAMHKATNKPVIVIEPSILLAGQAYNSAKAVTNESMCLWADLSKTSHDGTLPIVYVDVGYFLYLSFEGKLTTDCTIILDECDVDSAEYQAVRRLLMKLANRHLVVQVTVRQDSEDVGKVQVLKVDNLTDDQVVKKNVIRFFPSYEDAIAAKENHGPTALILSEYSSLAEYQRVVDALLKKDTGCMIYAPVSLATGLNLPVDVVVGTNRQVGIVLNNDKLQAQAGWVDQQTVFQQARRAGRFGASGKAFFPSKSTVEKPIGRSGEELCGDWLFAKLANEDMKFDIEGLTTQAINNTLKGGHPFYSLFKLPKGIVSSSESLRKFKEPDKFENKREVHDKPLIVEVKSESVNRPLSSKSFSFGKAVERLRPKAEKVVEGEIPLDVLVSGRAGNNEMGYHASRYSAWDHHLKLLLEKPINGGYYAMTEMGVKDLVKVLVYRRNWFMNEISNAVLCSGLAIDSEVKVDVHGVLKLYKIDYLVYLKILGQFKSWVPYIYYKHVDEIYSDNGWLAPSHEIFGDVRDGNGPIGSRPLGNYSPVSDRKIASGKYIMD